MTAAQLIEELQKYPPHTPVTHLDGENGRMTVTNVNAELDYYLSDVQVIELS